MSGKSPLLLIEHMLECAAFAQKYTQEINRDGFLADTRTQHAVALNLLVIGETASRIEREYPSFAAEHRDVVWHKMRGMRNQIAHNYADIDLDIGWKTTQTILPQLISQLEPILATLEKDDAD